MSKATLIMAIAVASVATTLVTGVVYADEKNGKPFEEIWKAIHEMELTPGPPGADGTNAITHVYQVVTEQKISNQDGVSFHKVRATCDPGDTVLGGGYESIDGITIMTNKPSTTSAGDDGWLVIFETGSGKLKTVTVEARCATISP